MTRRLTTLATNRTRRVLAAAAGLFLLAAVAGVPVTGMLGSSGRDFQDPASQYERTNTAITHATGQDSYYEVIALLRGPTRIGAHAASGRAVQTVAALLAAQRGFRSPPAGMMTRPGPLLSRDDRETLLTATYAGATDATGAVAHVRAALAAPGAKAKLAGMSVRFGGYALINKELNELTTSDLARAELLGFPFLLLLSFWFFRGLVAALLPILVGGLAILLTFLALRVIDQFVPVSVFSLNLVSGMGLGLGIDYSLFVLYRYREELAAGFDTHSAIERTLATVGRTVLFSSLTVAAAMTSLLVFPLRFLYSMGIGGTVVVLCDGAVALLLLPAVLVALGPRINALSPGWLQRRAARSASATEDGGWWRLAHGVVRRPAPVAVISSVVLLAAAIPAFHLTFTSPGANLLPANAPSHEVETALAKDFPANAGEATEVVIKAPRPTAQRLAAAAAVTAGRMASVSAPRALGRGTWEIELLPRGSPVTSAQQRLLSRLRALARPYGALVGGATAYFADQRSAVASHIPLALLILLPLTAGFLFLMTGSVLIPVKALVMNALSVSVAVGLQVLIFQDGHLSGPLGFKPIGGLEESSLVLMLVLAFALATDYEVFVLARIKEAHDRGLPNREAIALGIERTGRIVTAAALLFCVAIGVLTTSELFFTKQLGLGAALAVAVDASIVRALLVPSLMALMGKWNWWAPRPLRRLHDRMGLQESAPAAAKLQ
ncbi:MAG: MMPL family transporter [Solirubrobacterales bacterium]